MDAGDVGNVILATNGYTATFANAGPGSGIAVTVSGLTLTGSAANNYTLTQPTGLTANITPPAASDPSDNFDRADASDLGGNWTTLSGTSPFPFGGHLATTNNQACASAAGVDCYSYWSADSFNGDQYSQAVIATNGNYTAVIVRAGGSTPNRFYFAYVTATGYGIAVYWDGNYAGTLISGSTVTWQAGDTNRLEVTGSASPVTLTMYRNGSPVLTTSTSVYVKADGSPGIGINSSTVPGLALDNWEGANLSSLTTVTVAGITANNKVYDGTTAATINTNGYMFSGVAAEDVGNVILATNGYTATFASAGPGNGIAVTVSGLTLTGSAASKYTLTQPTGLTANITPLAWVAVASDNFDRGDASDLGGNWTALSGTSPFPFGGHLATTNNQACANAASR